MTISVPRRQDLAKKMLATQRGQSAIFSNKVCRQMQIKRLDSCDKAKPAFSKSQEHNSIRSLERAVAL